MEGYNHAVVTGASGGIGSALCRELDRRGIGKITLHGRDERALRALSEELGCPTHLCIADLSTADGVAELAACTQEADLLFNNAGFGSFGRFSESNATEQMKMVSVNCSAPVALAATILPAMIANGTGCIVNIASGMAFQPMPYMSTYAATKAFLLSWSEAVSVELAGTGVQMLTVCPGTVDTGFATAAGVPIEAIPGVSLVQTSMDTVVTATFAAIRHNRTVSVPGMGNRLGCFAASIAPRWLVRTVLGLTMNRGHNRLSD